MARYRRSRRTLTVIVLIVLSLTIISLDLAGRTDNVTSGIKSGANDVYSPVRNGVMDVLSPIGGFFAGAVNYRSLQSENEKLQAQIGQLQMQRSERQAENVQLRQLTALENLPFLQSLPTVTAQTQNAYASNFTATITLDKGRADGVDVGYPVVGAGGLLGQVIEASHHTSMVRLITDGQSKVGASFGNQLQFSGIVDGQGSNQSMTAVLVAPHTPLHTGEMMFTSGLSAGSYPKGIPVAKVASFRTAAGSNQETVTLAPAANLGELGYVDVVQWEPSS